MGTTALLIAGAMSCVPASVAGGKPVFRKPPPKGVVELTGLGIESLIALRDGSLLGNNGRVSADGGLTWSAPRTLAEGVAADGLVRLRSGAIALTGQAGDRYAVCLSHDEGRAFGPPTLVDMLGSPYFDVLTELSSGRLLYPSRTWHYNDKHPELRYEDASSYGMWRGLRLQVEGHYHYPEIDIASVSRSDDQGKSWQRCEGVLMGWFDAKGMPNGRGGVTACDEPSVAETKDKRVLFLARSTVGRLVASYSADGGETWSAVRPTELACSYSPPRLRRIPSTGDLLCLWNQVSREEIRRGHRRGRLSAAVSTDSGATWGHFRTLELSAGLKDVDRVSPESPITPIVARQWVGRLPDDWSTFDYANACFVDEKVYLIYHRSWVECEGGEAATLGERTGKAVKPGELVLRLYPLEWFYR